VRSYQQLLSWGPATPLAFLSGHSLGKLPSTSGPPEESHQNLPLAISSSAAMTFLDLLHLKMRTINQSKTT
jgi:hypothetical protein